MVFSDLKLSQWRSFKRAAPEGKGLSRKTKKKIVDVKFDKAHLEQFNVVYEDVPKKLPFSRLFKPFVFAGVVSGRTKLFLLLTFQENIPPPHNIIQ